MYVVVLLFQVSGCSLALDFKGEVGSSFLTCQSSSSRCMRLHMCVFAFCPEVLVSVLLSCAISWINECALALVSVSSVHTQSHLYVHYVCLYNVDFWQIMYQCASDTMHKCVYLLLLLPLCVCLLYPRVIHTMKCLSEYVFLGFFPFCLCTCVWHMLINRCILILFLLPTCNDAIPEYLVSLCAPLPPSFSFSFFFSLHLFSLCLNILFTLTHAHINMKDEIWLDLIQAIQPRACTISSSRHFFLWFGVLLRGVCLTLTPSIHVRYVSFLCSLMSFFSLDMVSSSFLSGSCLDHSFCLFPSALAGNGVCCFRCLGVFRALELKLTEEDMRSTFALSLISGTLVKQGMSVLIFVCVRYTSWTIGKSAVQRY